MTLPGHREPPPDFGTYLALDNAPGGGDRAIADGPPLAEIIGGDLDDVMGDCRTMGVPRRRPGRGAMDRASRPALRDGVGAPRRRY